MICFRHIAAVLFRHIISLARISWLVEITYWTALDLIIFGSIGRAVALTNTGPAALGTLHALVASVVLWYVVLRSGITIGFAFLNELFDSNLTALFATPLTTLEWMIAIGITSALSAIINFITGWAMAWIVFDYNLLSIGWPIIATIGSLLISGWAVGLFIMSFLVFLGKKGTSMTFALCWSLVPFSGVYYPVSVLPPMLQTLAQYIPMAHAFEAIRQYITNQASPWHHLATSLWLNAIFVLLAMIVFHWSLKISKNRGLARLELEW